MRVPPPAPTTCAILLLAATVTAQDLRRRDGPRCTSTVFATDTARGRIVVLDEAGATQEWDGTRWLRRPAAGPSHLTFRCVYDPVARRTIGLDARTPVLTWDYDGAVWRRHDAPATPAAVAVHHALAFDVVRGRPLLFGGQGPGTPFVSLTFEWNGTAWVALTPPVSPPGREYAAMASDSGRGRAVLFGGRGSAGLLNDTWEWDGATWLPRQFTVRPAARAFHAMAYDASRQRTVLHGGQDVTTRRDDLWEYDGTAWQATVVSGTSPGPRAFATLLPDPASSELVLLGGVDAGDNEPRTGFRWNGVRWQRYADLPELPRWRAAASIAYEPRTGGALMSGGGVGIGQVGVDETWRWNGQDWSRVAGSGPPLRLWSAMWSDLVDTFVFGGTSGSAFAVLNDTWRWNGTTWTQVATAASPPPRNMTAVAYDVGRGRAVLFGGAGMNGVLDDTWTFDGTNWRRENPPSSPAGRGGHGLANDLLRNRVVLYGGESALLPGALNDTWEWDGVTWQARAPIVSPPAVSRAAMDFSLRLGRVVLVQKHPFRNVAQVFTYDGVTWSPIPLATEVALGDGHALLHRLASHRLDVVDGNHVYELSLAPALAAIHGSSCGVDPPVLTAHCEPRLGAADFGLEIVRAPANAPVGIAGGTASSSIAIGPCTQLVSPILASVFLLANAGGFAQLDLAVPANPALLGTQLFFQGAAIDATAPGGFTTTAGLRVVVGD